MNDQYPPSTPEPKSTAPAVANFQAYGNAGVMHEDGSSSLTDSDADQSREGPAQAFMEALQSTEREHSPQPLVERFSDTCQLWRQSHEQTYEGSSGVQNFWTEYLKPFESVATRFTRVTERDGLAILEWESRGTLQGGRPIHYRGVSILEFDADGQVHTFKTYFDSAQFISFHAATGGTQPS